ncbi:MAG TPA: hypothetical protein VNI57_06135 [Candidatus Saccharimonadales bacterium]|nr:hypothetical protein [Candidatus Saccharimonadales bacterium]
MAYLLVRHKVKDFESWKKVFEEHGRARESLGCKGGRLMRNAEVPNEVVVLLEWDFHENARKFVDSEDLKSTMQRAGVLDRPDIYYLDVEEEVIR